MATNEAGDLDRRLHPDDGYHRRRRTVADAVFQLKAAPERGRFFLDLYLEQMNTDLDHPRRRG